MQVLDFNVNPYEEYLWTMQEFDVGMIAMTCMLQENGR